MRTWLTTAAIVVAYCALWAWRLWPRRPPQCHAVRNDVQCERQHGHDGLHDSDACEWPDELTDYYRDPEVSMQKLFCKKHNVHAYPYIVCPHVVYDDATVVGHLKPEDGDGCGEIACSLKHSGTDEHGRDPVVMCEMCAMELLSERATEIG